MTLPGSAAQAKGSGLSFTEEALDSGLEMDERSEHASRGGFWLQRINKITVSDKSGSPLRPWDGLGKQTLRATSGPQPPADAIFAPSRCAILAQAPDDGLG
jgi:hypothetical protein